MSARRAEESSTADNFLVARGKAPSSDEDAGFAVTPAARPAAVARGESGPWAPTTLDRIAPFRRILWVTRWDFNSPEDIRRICYNAASARFTDILFQVRGAGTVFYNSRIEPWAGELSGSPVGAIGRDPGWDPLAVAVRESHKMGLRLHAYMNALPGWGAQEETPSASSGQLFAIHRSWFMVNAAGRTMRPGSSYCFLDPGLPQVRAYLAKLYGEVAEHYAVDGVHLDYIRYPDERGDYSYHPRVLETFESLFGGRPSQQPESWAQFRRNQITETVRTIARAVHAARPKTEVSAAVVADRSRQTNVCYQSALEWVRGGELDAIAPMAYSGEMDKFDELCQPYRADDVRKRVWLGVWADPKRNSHLEAEVRRAAGMGFGAVAVFSYSELFPEHRASSRATCVYQAFTSKRTTLSQAF